MVQIAADLSKWSKLRQTEGPPRGRWRDQRAERVRKDGTARGEVASSLSASCLLFSLMKISVSFVSLFRIFSSLSNFLFSLFEANLFFSAHPFCFPSPCLLAHCLLPDVLSRSFLATQSDNHEFTRTSRLSRALISCLLSVGRGERSPWRCGSADASWGRLRTQGQVRQDCPQSCKYSETHHGYESLGGLVEGTSSHCRHCQDRLLPQSGSQSSRSFNEKGVRVSVR